MKELFSLVGKIAVENEEANRAIQETTNQAESGSSGIMGAFKKVGTVVAGAMAVDKVIEFGTACVESAATVQAQNAQFAASFGDLQGKATEAFGRVSDSTGILSTRLQVEGTKAFSMFKGAGMDANEALGESEKFLGLAADAAAYYDISLEEASERVLGFAKGNFENGDAIGVFTNEAQRNTIAMDKYGKKFSECTEAQKQMLALDMIENTYELSGALGQASREADGYENVMGNLKEAWRQFTAIIGAPILAAVIPIIKGITSGIQSLNTWLGNISGTFSSSNSSMAGIWASIGAPLFSSIQQVGQTLLQAWNIIFPTLQALFITLWNTVQVVWNTIGQPVFTVIGSVIQYLLTVFNASFPVIVQVVSDAIVMINTILRQILFPVLQAVGDFINTFLVPVFTTAFSIIGNVVSAAWTFIGTLWTTVLQPILMSIITFIGGVFQGDWTMIWEAIKGIVSSVWNAIVLVVQTAINLVASVIQNVMNAIMSVISSIWNAILSVISGVLNAISSVVSSVWNGIKSVITGVVNGIQSVVSGVWNGIKNTTSSVFNSIKSITSSVWNGIKSAIESPMNAAKDVVRSIIDTIKGFFNFTIQWPHIPMPHFSISPAGWKIGDLLKGSIPSLGVDWYAEGGILEKPTAFGVSPNGRLRVGGEAGAEAVAPIDTLMDYVSEAVRSENGNVEKLLKMILKAILDQKDMDVVLDSGAMVGALAPKMDKELGKIQGRKARR